MEQSVAERIFCVIEKRLRRINKTDGYNTDAGLNVFRARRSIDIAELPAISIWDGGETPTDPFASANCDQDLVINIEAHALVNQDETGLVMEQIKADIKHALFGDNPNGSIEELNKLKIAAFGYRGCVPSPREDGANSESITMHFLARYKENLAA
jgi:hypothetical protein